MTFLIRQNGQTMAHITADSAENALEYFGLKMNELCDDIEKVITHYGLDFTRYGTTYGFNVEHGVAAVMEI